MKLPANFTGATQDSRKVLPGMLFVAIKGENVDGHDFIPQALAAGAVGVIDGPDELAEAAKAYRRTLKAKVVGVTGSSGKTTTKEMLRALLSRIGKTHANTGNLNNHIGLPLTILNTPRDAEFLVVEMGTNHPGEIAALCDIAEPDAGLVTSVGTAHMEFFKTQGNIALEKGELLRRVRDFGVVSSECAQLDVLRSLRPEDLVVVDPNERWIADALSESLPGRHNVSNAALACALAGRYGLSREDAEAALRGIELPGERWNVTESHGVKFVNDAYNANPSSMAAVLDTFAEMECGGRRIAVLGDMFELGAASERYHREIGARVGRMLEGGRLAFLVAVGRQSCDWMADEAEKAAPRQICRAADAKEAGKIVASLARAGDAVLLKASRGMKLECALKEFEIS